MKKFIGLILVIALMLSVNITTFAGDTIYVTLDGSYIEFDVEPQNINGRIMVPIRAIFEKMGATVTWDGSTGSAICTKGDTTVIMTIDSMYMYVNSQVVEMDVSPVVINGRTLAPARYVAEAFGADVQWSQEYNTVVIRTGGAVENMVTLYSLDGRTIEVLESEVPAQKTVGWYETLAETQQTLYSADGRTLTVFKAEVPAQKTVGWYETRAEAQAAGRSQNNTPVSSNTHGTSNTYNPSSDGNYYITPTGKKYHLDPNCGGKNSYKTTNISGYEPCSKCAK